MCFTSFLPSLFLFYIDFLLPSQLKCPPIFLTSPFKSLKDLFLLFLILYECVYGCFGRPQHQIPLQVDVARVLGIELGSCKNSECMILTIELFLQFYILHLTVIHHLLFSAFRFFFKCSRPSKLILQPASVGLIHSFGFEFSVLLTFLLPLSPP